MAAIDDRALLHQSSSYGGQTILILILLNNKRNRTCLSVIESVISIHTYFVPLDTMVHNSIGIDFRWLPFHRVVARVPKHTSQVGSRHLAYIIHTPEYVRRYSD